MGLLLVICNVSTLKLMHTSLLNPEQFMADYGYVVDDLWYPRVTRIVEIKSKPALYRFYASLPSYEAGERVKEQSAAEGTLVHETVEKLLLGERPPVPFFIEPAIRAFLEFVKFRNIHVDADYIEHRLVHYEHRYAGTLDAIAMIDGKLGILDIKTSQSIYRDYNLQTSAYLMAMKEHIPRLETRWILRIDQHRTCKQCAAIMRSKGGKDKIRTISYGASKHCEHDWNDPEGKIELREFPYWENDFEAFLGAKRLWEWEHEGMLRQIGYLAE